MSLILKSIEEEADDCRAAWKGFKVGTFALHCHHEILAEPLREDAENRIAYILSAKPRIERALRLRLFRPVSEKVLAEWKKAYAADAEWEKADAEREKADAEWDKARAEWEKAAAERKKAYAEWEKAYAEWKKARAEWEKAYAEWKKADAERRKADAERRKAYAEWEKAYAEWKRARAEREKADAEREKAYANLAILVHTAVCKDCPWSGKTIFPKENQ